MGVHADQVARWSAAIREFDPLEPWLTESALDESYWDDVATLVVERLGDRTDQATAIHVLRSALIETFPSAELQSDNGFYRDHVEERLRRITAQALG